VKERFAEKNDVGVCVGDISANVLSYAMFVGDTEIVRPFLRVSEPTALSITSIA